MRTWIKIEQQQPKEGDKIIAKIFNGEKIIKFTVAGDIWDYGIIEWKYQ